MSHKWQALYAMEFLFLRSFLCIDKKEMEMKESGIATLFISKWSEYGNFYYNYWSF